MPLHVSLQSPIPQHVLFLYFLFLSAISTLQTAQAKVSYDEDHKIKRDLVWLATLFVICLIKTKYDNGSMTLLKCQRYFFVGGGWSSNLYCSFEPTTTTFHCFSSMITNYNERSGQLSRVQGIR